MGGLDYDRTLMAWWRNFEAAWPVLQHDSSAEFFRFWRYYLLSCAGFFRSRQGQLWQLVLSQGGAVLLVALVLVCWPGLPLESQRSLVLALLVWSAGALVWLNAGVRSGLGALALFISVLLWGVLQGWPALSQLLGLAPLAPGLLGGLMAVAILLWISVALARSRVNAADLQGAGSR